MRTTTPFLLLFAATSLAACSGKSKLDKCNDVCAKILDEELAACSTDGCRADAREKHDACRGLCDTALGKGSKNAGKTAERKSPEDLKTSCEKGSGEDCVTVAGLYLKGLDGLPRSDKDAAKFLKAACDHDEVFGCTMYGKMLRDGRGVASDPGAARVIFTKACDKDEANACASLGLEAMSSDKKKGFALLKKACDLGDGLGCMGFGSLYLHGNGAPKDVAKAKTLLTKACDLGAKSACDKVREL